MPLLVGPMAPLQDWPSHLARAFILHEMLAAPAAFWHRYYEVGTFLLPNVALDLCLLGLMNLGVGVLAAGKLFLLATYALFCTGFRRLAVTFGAAGPLTFPLAALLFYSGTFFIGLINFVLGLGLTLWLVGAWVGQERWLPRLGLAVLGAAVVFFCHLIAALTFAGILLCLELQAALTTGGRGRTRPGTSLAAYALILILLLLSPSSGHALAPEWYGAGSLESLVRWKASIFGSALFGGAFAADVVLLLGGTAFLILVLSTCRVRLAGPTGLVTLALLAATLILPERVGLGSLFDFRLGLVPIVFAAATARVTARRAPNALTTAATALAALVLVRAAVLAIAWHGAGATTDAIGRALAGLPRESLVLAGFGRLPDQIPWAERWGPALTNIAAIGTFNGLFVPTVFAFPTQQPLVLRPAWNGWTAARQVDTPQLLRGAVADAQAMCSQFGPDGVAMLVLHPGHALDVADQSVSSITASGDRFALLRLCQGSLATLSSAGHSGTDPH